MIRRLAAGVAGCLTGCLMAVTAAFAELENGGFEQAVGGGAPAGWAWTRTGYEVSLSSDGAVEGERCLRLAWVGEGEPTSFGNVMQSLDAQRYRGRRLRFRASVRVEQPGQAQLWFRVDRQDGGVGFFDNMDTRPIVSGSWAEYEIVGDVDRDAAKVNVGILLLGAGALQADAVRLEIVGEAPRPVDPTPPRALTERGLANLAAFARLFGLVRYFHPTDEAAVCDWERLAVGGARAVEEAEDAADLARILGQIFHPVAPSVAVFPAGANPGPGAEAPAGTRLRANLHHGHFRSARVEVAPGDPTYTFPAKAPAVELGGGVSCRVPLTVPVDQHGTIPRATAEARFLLGANLLPDARDRASRLGAVVVAWNVLQHFYPYFDVVDADWPAELREALSAAATDDGVLAFLRTLRRMTATLDDGHAAVQHDAEVRGLLLPVLFTWIDDELVVVAARPDAGLAPGDVVIALDGVPVADLVRDKAAEISGATPQWIRVRLLNEIARCASPAPRTLLVRRGARDAEPFSVQLRPKAPTDTLPVPPRPQALEQVEPGVWYVDTTRFDAAAFRDALPELSTARGLVFDFRGYPGGLDRDLFFSHLSADTLLSPEWHLPIVRRPDRVGLEFLQEGRWTIPPEAPLLPGRKAFLIDGRAVSFAESCLGIVEAYRLGELVGEATAGTNGDVVTVELPGDYKLRFTGLRVLKHDGSRHHGVGIRPTAPAAPTLAGVAAGRDEVLERALALVRQ